MAESKWASQAGLPGLLGPAVLMVGARLISMAMGIIAIPFLLHYLGSTAFAAWALLLALAAGFALLDMGAPAVIVRYLAAPAAAGNWQQARSMLGAVWVLLALSFGTGLMVTLWAAEPLSAWLRLPDTALFAARETVCIVFVASMLRAFLATGTYTLYAARQFSVTARIAVLQPLLANLAAIFTALGSGRLDLTLLAYWSVQLGVLGVNFVASRGLCQPRFDGAARSLPRLREMCAYGLKARVDQLAQFINFQFDKFIIAGFVGLWAVAPYEVANRCVLALRSIPASGVETMLPGAVVLQTEPGDTVSWYFASTRIAVYSVCIFMLAPLAVAPVFLYAWTGEMGYYGRWVFAALIAGAIAGVLTLPAAILAQATGHEDLPAKSAALSILFNIPLSLLLVLKWGPVGAAVGTGIALLLSAMQLFRSVHAHFGWRVSATLRTIAHLWPPVLVCVCYGALTYWIFNEWFATLDASVRYARPTRVGPGLLALLTYGLCFGGLFFVELARGAFTPEERGWLTRAIPFKWFARLAGRGRT